MFSIFPQTKESQQHPAKCKFCELSVQLSNLDIHEYQCGSRTEHCPHCNQRFTLRVLAQHKDLCLSAKGKPKEGKRIVSPGRKTHCDICKQMIPEHKYASHMVSSNYPLSTCARSQFIFQRARCDSRFWIHFPKHGYQRF